LKTDLSLEGVDDGLGLGDDGVDNRLLLIDLVDLGVDGRVLDVHLLVVDGVAHGGGLLGDLDGGLGGGGGGGGGATTGGGSGRGRCFSAALLVDAADEASADSQLVELGARDLQHLRVGVGVAGHQPSVLCAHTHFGFSAGLLLFTYLSDGFRPVATIFLQILIEISKYVCA